MSVTRDTTPMVRWANGRTGEIKDRQQHGVETNVDAWGQPYSNEWRQTALQIALDIVPDLIEAIEAAWANGKNLDVGVQETER